MTPGSLSTSCWAALLLVLPVRLPAADPVIAYGLTNVAIGQANLNIDDYYGRYWVSNLGSNGVDGVSVYLGEPDSGVFFSPSTGYLENGYRMAAKIYGRLHGTNDALLAVIQGARASRIVYPLSLDYSPLAPESVTYQIFYNGMLQREFTRGTPIVTVEYGYGTYPIVNPLFRRSDGALGTLLTLTTTVDFVFPELLDSATGNELFIRLNNPANVPGPLSRMDVFGGGRLGEFTFNDLGLGVFGRSHRSWFGVNLQARPNWLRLDNFVNTNDLPGVVIDLERLGALNLQFEPFQIGNSNAFLVLTPTGAAAGELYRTLGTLRLERQEDRVSIGYEQDLLYDISIVVLTNGIIAHTDSIFVGETLSVGTNARIGSITAHAKTVENLPGFHVQFAEPTSVTIASNATVVGDEVRLLLPYPARMEHLHTLYLSGRGLDSLTLTNEIATVPAGAARIQIFHIPDHVVLKWPDPNRLLRPLYSDRDLYSFYNYVTNDLIFSDPYASVTVPIVRTNKITFFQLFYSPYE